ncbi:MAG: energy transducer TonB [Spartobacteria bacterium]
MLFPGVLRFLFATFALASVAAAQSPFRPALVGNGPKSLVNQIDAKKLAAKGQGDAVVMFECYIGHSGKAEDGRTYRGTPDSKYLAREVEEALKRSYFIPAAYKGKPVSVYFAGAAMFYVIDGKPQLHVYANQSSEDLKQGKDFIAPQLISGTDDWDSAKTELEKARLHQRNGAAVLALRVGTDGQVKDIRVASEDPPNYNFGRAAVKEYTKAVFIPGFRNGKPVECSFDYTSYVLTYRKPQITRLNATLFPQ